MSRIASLTRASVFAEAGKASAPAFTSCVTALLAAGLAPMRRWGEPADFGGIAVYLASDASKYHTADTFVIDGGYLVF